MNTPASKPPPPGIYIPAVLFFDENDELDFESMKSHILRLAQVGHKNSILDQLIEVVLQRLVLPVSWSKGAMARLSFFHTMNAKQL